MKITLEMVDEVIARTGASYQNAKDALLKTEGDILEAIVLLEEQAQVPKEHAIIKVLKDLVEKGKVSKILVERDGKQILNIPVAAGVIGGLIFATPTVIAITAAIVSGCDIFIITPDQNKVNVVEYTKEKYDDVVKPKKPKETEENKSEEEGFYEADMDNPFDDNDKV